MACESNAMSDERIGEALIKEVIEEELKAVGEEAPPLTPLVMQVRSEQEQQVVTQLGTMIRIIGDRVRDDKEFQDAIDGITRGSASKSERFLQVANKVFEHGEITWERIAVLFYVAGRIAVTMVKAHLPRSVAEILRWTVDFFKTNLLKWIREHGGWINSFSEFAQLSVQRVSSLNSHVCSFALIFITGLALGSFITWRLTRNL
ncbi:apoptosis regulator BAX-like [Genypterus blacodes]|uniref:apoptosis regulator BAX-like n=1 Tax=Genypterus blacodes TaxID=154954 RepID=UPI003F76D47C